jgi:hypothetical protein
MKHFFVKFARVVKRTRDQAPNRRSNFSLLLRRMKSFQAALWKLEDFF